MRDADSGDPNCASQSLLSPRARSLGDDQLGQPVDDRCGDDARRNAVADTFEPPDVGLEIRCGHVHVDASGGEHVERAIEPRRQVVA
jgi:hypothetical protein